MFNATLVREVKDRHRPRTLHLNDEPHVLCTSCSHAPWPCDAARLADAYETLLLTTQPNSPSVGSVTVSSTGTCDCQICRP